MPSYTVTKDHFRMHRYTEHTFNYVNWMGGVMQILRLLKRQARSTWTRIQASSKPSYCGKSIICQGTIGNTSLCMRSEQADNKSTIYLRIFYENQHKVGTSMKYFGLVDFQMFNTYFMVY